VRKGGRDEFGQTQVAEPCHEEEVEEEGKSPIVKMRQRDIWMSRMMKCHMCCHPLIIHILMAESTRQSSTYMRTMVPYAYEREM